MRKVLLAAFVITLLAGCSTSDQIIMSKGEETRACGPYTTGGNIPAAAMTNQRKLESCVSDYQRQGYNRQ